ncbi:MAG: type VI secretion system baseplate subunit TssG, partial [Hansschlegelia sp.]
EPALQARLRPGVDPLLFYSGAFAARPRSADRLAAILSDWMGRPVVVEQFAGVWLELGRDQMTALPKGGAGRFNQLGVDAAVGARAWDIQSRVAIRIGPLDLRQFRALLPGGGLLEPFAALIRAYLGGGTGFVVNPVLAASAVAAPTLGPASPCLLGWTGWLPISAGRKTDAGEATFSSSAIADAEAA